MRLLATPSFLQEAATCGFNHLPLIQKLLTGPEPSWLVGDPESTTEKAEDEGRTLRVPAPFPFYIIRDDYEEEGAVITALLKHEY